MDILERQVRVLLVFSSFARTSGGGASFMTGLARALVADPRLSVTIVLPKGSTRPTESGRVEYIYVAPLRGIARIVRDVASCARWALKSRADVVLIPHEYAAPVPSASVINVVQNILYLHESSKESHRARRTAMRLIIRLTSPFASETVCVSDESATLWSAICPSRTVVLPQGISEAFVPLREPASMTSKCITVVTGQQPYKRPDIARELVDQLRNRWPSMDVQVIGIDDTPSRTAPKFWTQEQMVRQFQRSHAVILCSTVESFGLPAFEARACGAYAIVHPSTAMSQWLADDPGTLTAALIGASALAEQLSFIVDADPAAPAPNHYWSSVGTRWADAVVNAASNAPITN